MSNNHDAGDELPPGLLALWSLEEPIVVALKPRDAWVALGVIQFAARNPMISAAQRQIIEQFGRGLQRGLAALDPGLEKYLEMGWDPQHDRPRKG